MSETWQAVTAALIAGVGGTGFGGLVGCIGSGRRLLSGILAFSAGLMMGVVTFELLPEALDMGGFITTSISMAVGAALVWLIAKMFPQGDMDNVQRMGYTVLLAITLHNFPEGLAIGSGWAALPELGFRLALVIALHDFPEGLAVSAPLAASGQKHIWRNTMLAAASGLPTALGAIVGVWVGNISPLSISACMGGAAGAMLYVVLGEMIPQLLNLPGRLKVFWQMVGFSIGVYLSL